MGPSGIFIHSNRRKGIVNSVNSKGLGPSFKHGPIEDGNPENNAEVA